MTRDDAEPVIRFWDYDDKGKPRHCARCGATCHIGDENMQTWVDFRGMCVCLVCFVKWAAAHPGCSTLNECDIGAFMEAGK